MLGIEDYGSDAESGDEGSKATTTLSISRPTATVTSSLLPPTPKSALALPPPKSATSSLSLPAPSRSSSNITSTDADGTTAHAPPKPKRTKKIAINLPSLPRAEGDADADEGGPPSKKPRITSTSDGTGAGKSSLLGMLPAPKQSVSVIQKKKEEAERVLGGRGRPGLVFQTQPRDDPRVTSVASTEEGGATEVEGPVNADVSGLSTSFLPSSLKKGRTNVSLEDEREFRKVPIQPKIKSAAPSVDFFSLGSSATSARSTPTPSHTPTPSTSSVTVALSAPSTSVASTSSSVTISSAPAISTFRPPSPTLDDAYPGYYQLPSGAYAPYDAEYYASYAHKWKADYDKHIRALEKSQYEPEADGAQNVDMGAEMEKARREIKEREDRKALTTGNVGKGEDGEPAMPRMNMKGAKLGSVARSRHQLTTLLTEAYLNREALEEKIAQGRRNRKEAGNKYGF